MWLKCSGLAFPQVCVSNAVLLVSTVHTPQLVLHEHANLSEAPSLWLGFLKLWRQTASFFSFQMDCTFFVAMNVRVKRVNGGLPRLAPPVCQTGEFSGFLLRCLSPPLLWLFQLMKGFCVCFNTAPGRPGCRYEPLWPDVPPSHQTSVQWADTSRESPVSFSFVNKKPCSLPVFVLAVLFPLS